MISWAKPVPAPRTMTTPSRASPCIGIESFPLPTVASRLTATPATRFEHQRRPSSHTSDCDGWPSRRRFPYLTSRNGLEIQRLLNEVAQDRITRANRYYSVWRPLRQAGQGSDNGAGQPDVCPSKAWQGFVSQRVLHVYGLAVTGWRPQEDRSKYIAIGKCRSSATYARSRSGSHAVAPPVLV